MSSYYDLLKVSQTATSVEIQTAIEVLYNQSRRLVTHHDPFVVQNANQNLLMIEQARSTLLDPIKRADYDTMLQLGAIGGLANPTAQPAAPVMAPPAPPRMPGQVAMPQPAVVPVDAWNCPKCYSVNPVGIKFCKKCGTQLGRDCPNCGHLVEASVQFCSECGVDIREFEQQREMNRAEEEQRRIVEERRKAEEMARLGVIIKASGSASKLMGAGWALTMVSLCTYFTVIIPILAGPVSLVLFGLSVVNALKALRQTQQFGDDAYRSKAKTALVLSGIPLGLTAIGIVFGILSVILSGISGAVNSY